jgi:hypothetical protein
MPESGGELFECSTCGKSKTPEEFKIKTNGNRARSCMGCQTRTCNAARDRKQEKENTAIDEEPEEGKGLAVLPVDDFLDGLTQQDDNLELEARVDIASISGGRREKADQLAVRIWNRMKYRFVCVSIQSCHVIILTLCPLVITANMSTSVPPPPDLCTTVRRASPVKMLQRKLLVKGRNTGIKLPWTHFTAMDGFMSPSLTGTMSRL